MEMESGARFLAFSICLLNKGKGAMKKVFFFFFFYKSNHDIYTLTISAD